MSKQLPQINDPLFAIFIAIQARLRAKCPKLGTIDQDYGQLENYTGKPSVSFTCALIDVESANYDDMAENAQTSVAEISVRLGFAPYSGSSDRVPKLVRHAALDYYETAWQVNKALHGWRPDMTDTGEYNAEEYSVDEYNVMERFAGIFGPMKRISDVKEERRDPIRVRELRYRVTLEDYSCTEDWETVEAAVELEDGITSTLAI